MYVIKYTHIYSLSPSLPLPLSLYIYIYIYIYIILYVYIYIYYIICIYIYIYIYILKINMRVVLLHARQVLHMHVCTCINVSAYVHTCARGLHTRKRSLHKLNRIRVKEACWRAASCSMHACICMRAFVRKYAVNMGQLRLVSRSLDQLLLVALIVWSVPNFKLGAISLAYSTGMPHHTPLVNTHMHVWRIQVQKAHPQKRQLKNVYKTELSSRTC